MDRVMVYPGQLPLETDVLSTNRNVLISIGMLMEAVLGTSTLVSGLTCTPSTPAALTVQIGAGQIFSLEPLDGTAYSSLAADTTHSVVKQGLSLDGVTLACPAPATSGYSITYLIEAAYQDADTGSTLLAYYNDSNPSVAWSGPQNSGTPQYTARQGLISLQAKAGLAATTGAQVAPAADAGYVGLWEVTVAYGQAGIVAADIAQAPGAPFIIETLTDKISQATADTLYATFSSLGSYKGAIGISTNTTLTAAQVGYFIEVSGGSGVGLPATSASLKGAVIPIYNSSTATVSVGAASGQAINNGGYGAATLQLQPGGSVILTTDGASWSVIGSTQVTGYSGAFGLTASTILTPAYFGGFIEITGGAGLTITLPTTSAGYAGRALTLYNATGTAVTLAAQSGQPINWGLASATTQTLAAGASVELTTDGSSWSVIAIGPGSPALTGTPTVPTAAPGTNSLQAANTAFVAAELGGYAPLGKLGAYAGVSQYNAPTTFTAADLNKLTVLGGAAGQSYTLAPSSVAGVGDRLILLAESGATVTVNAGDNIYSPVLSGYITSLTIPPGGTVALTKFSAGLWMITDGFAITRNTGLGGSGQAWTDVSGSRAIGSTYTNTTGAPISVSVAYQLTSGNGLALNVNGGAVAAVSGNSGTTLYQSMSAVVPNGGTYSVTYFVGSASTLVEWKELR